MVHRAGTQIPVCLLVTGPAVTNYGSIYESVAANMDAAGRGLVLNLMPSDSPNLKTTLKRIIQQGTASTFENDSDDEAIDSSRSKQVVCMIAKAYPSTDEKFSNRRSRLTLHRASAILITTFKSCMTMSKASLCLASSSPFRTARHSMAMCWKP